MMMIVLRLLSLLGLKSRLRPPNKVFFGRGGGVSLDSWTPGPKPLCHRHPTGPHPSGLAWTPVDSRQGDPTRSDFALGRRIPVEALEQGDAVRPQDVEQQPACDQAAEMRRIGDFVA